MLENPVLGLHWPGQRVSQCATAGPGLKMGDCSKAGLEVQTPLRKLNSIAWGSPTEFQGTIRKQTVAYR